MQGRGSEHHWLDAIALPRCREQLEQGGGGAEQGLAQIASDHGGNGRAEHCREGAVGPRDAPVIVHHRDPFRQRVERRLPLLLRVLHHLEKAGVRDHDGGVSGHGGEQPRVLGPKGTVARVRDHERADDDPMRPQWDGRRRVRCHVLEEVGGRPARGVHDLEPLPAQ